MIENQQLQQFEALSVAELKSQLEQISGDQQEYLPLLIVAGWKLAATDVAQAEAYNAEARIICKRLGITSYDALLMRNEAHCLYNRSQYTQALVLFEQAETLFEGHNAVSGRTGLLDLMIAMTHLSLDDDEAANQRARRSLTAGETSDDTYIITRSLTILGAVAGKHKNDDLALHWFQRCLPYYESDGDMGRVGGTMHNISRTHFELGNYDEALTYAEKALACYRQAGQLSGEIYANSVKGDIFLAQGNDEAALRCYAHALTVSEEIQRPTFALDFHRKIAEIHMKRGALDEAIAGYLQALATATQGYETDPVSDIHRQLANCYEQTGDLASAMHHLREHLRLQEKLVSAETEARLRHDQYQLELQLMRKDIEVERLKAVEARHQLEHADRLTAIGKMAAGIAHEINNPMQVIYGNLLLLTREHDTPALQRAIEQIERITRLVAGMREMYQFEVREERPLHMAEMVRNVLTLSQKTLSAAGIQVEKHLEDDLPPVCASATHLQQVILNLILNAQDAMPEGGILMLSTHYEPDTGMVVLRVEDTGEGIPDEQQKKVFDPFFTTRNKGSGLGLSICQNIVSHYGGAIRLTSEEGRGTQVEVRLPAQEGTKP